MSENRTNEFFSVARTVQSQKSQSLSSQLQQQQQQQQNQQNQQQYDAPNKKQQFQDLREFHQQAAGISKDIHTTSQLLTQLTDKVKYKSLIFQDQDAIEINQLVVRIKQSIENLNSRLDVASKTIQQQKRTFGTKSQIVTSSTNVVTALQNEFATAAAVFKDVLQHRTESMKESDDFKRTLYRNNNNTANGKGTATNSNDEDDDDDDIPDMTSHLLQAPPPVFGMDTNGIGGNNSMMGTTAMFPTLDLTSNLLDSSNIMTLGGGSTTSLPRPHGIAGNPGNNTNNNMYTQQRTTATTGSSSAPTTTTTTLSSSFHPSSYSQLHHQSSMPLTPFDIQRMEDGTGTGDGSGERMLQLLPTQQTDYLQSRADAMSAVEANIVELGTIFNKLAGLVNEHRELVQRVDDNVQDVNTNVLMSMNVLTDTLHNLRSNKMLTMKIGAILITFIILFIIFFA